MVCNVRISSLNLHDGPCTECCEENEGEERSKVPNANHSGRVLLQVQHHVHQGQPWRCVELSSLDLSVGLVVNWVLDLCG